MLTAVLNGKRRGTGFTGQSFISGDLVGAEDVLTSTIFERIAYLPNSIFLDFMDHALGCEDSIGTLENIDFWPSWYFNGQRVEPDAVLYSAC